MDGDAATAYVAGRAAQPGESLQVDFSAPRPVDQVVVLQTGGPAKAAVQVRPVDGDWITIGDLADGHTQLDARRVRADAVRLAWADGTPAPQVNEIIPWFADVPPADVTVDPASTDAEAGGQPATATVRLASTRAEDVTGTLTVTAPTGLTVQPASQDTTVLRGQDTGIPVTVTAAAGTPSGPYEVHVAFVPTGGSPVRATLTVHVYPMTGDTNVGLAANGGIATASSTKLSLPRFTPENAIDGDRSTRWSSNYNDDEWLQVELAQPRRIGKVVLRWEAAYGKAYRIETSSDGATWTTTATVATGDGGVDTRLRADPRAPLRQVGDHIRGRHLPGVRPARLHVGQRRRIPLQLRRALLHPGHRRRQRRHHGQQAVGTRHRLRDRRVGGGRHDCQRRLLRLRHLAHRTVGYHVAVERLTDGTWVTDAYLWTGMSGPINGWC
ncbi:discoidin domain-containing protein [Micromonospora sp. NBC_00389]|uniref:discoidin domain-containing protein n=1 Tax=Micromonospora sp. NBC_00389 TaxID=2903586 RepID=UPI002E1E2EDE